ncbi:MAG TPA: hypothetical protein VFC51_15035 [Chloroflexota bacterium]|nr:hypothetical protein [Chloroflexota bacterium]
MSRIVVSGALANKPGNGGNAWSRLSWLRGFQQLGFDVAFIEQIDPSVCVASDGSTARVEESVNLAYLWDVAEAFDLAGSAALIDCRGGLCFGMTATELRDLADDTALLVNIGGHLRVDWLRGRFRRTAFFDDDPGFTQFWWAAGRADLLPDHHHYWLTVGANIGQEGCPVPTCGLPWQPVRPPVTLDDWATSSDGAKDRFTTVGTWRGPYGPIEWNSTTYGLKVHEFRKFLDLPRRSPHRFEIALDIHPADAVDRDALGHHGWRLVDPRIVADSPARFRAYVQESGAEFSAAQGMYVRSQGGWLSDRTVRYLAAGRPAVVQDTGIARSIPVGEGLLVVRTVEEAARAVNSVARDYERHARAALQLAREYFDANRVLTSLLEEIDLAY